MDLGFIILNAIDKIRVMTPIVTRQLNASFSLINQILKLLNQTKLVHVILIVDFWTIFGFMIKGMYVFTMEILHLVNIKVQSIKFILGILLITISNKCKPMDIAGNANS